MEKTINKRAFGRTGLQITCVGLGGEGVLRSYYKEDAAKELIDTAAGQGIEYFDSAHAYAGSQGYFGHFWRKNANLRQNIFQTSKSASRDRKKALSELDNSLRTMGIEYLDLWQIHDVRNQADLQAIESPGGALEAFLEAKEKGKVRFIGVSGHEDPGILTRAVQKWPVDTVLMPVNPIEAVLGGFLDTTLPAALDKGIAVIAMKVLGSSRYLVPEAGITPGLLIKYALSYDISLAIVGCSTPREVMTLAQVGRTFIPLSPKERQEIESFFQPTAPRLAYYRSWG